LLYLLLLSCRAVLKLVPHTSFTFAKLWLLAAKLEVRIPLGCNSFTGSSGLVLETV
jgi:hypothetical protein